VLVDVRHEATHTELPSLALLRLAAGRALDWLRAGYWQRQADHVASEHARVRQLLQVRQQRTFIAPRRAGHYALSSIPRRMWYHLSQFHVRVHDEQHMPDLLCHCL
jgi:ribosomal biogenesis protein LAS1